MIDALNLAVSSLSLFVAFGGIWLAVWTLRRGNRNSSAALVYSMQLGFIDVWASYLEEEDNDKRPLKMSNILGLIETSAAIYCDTAMAGSSGELMEEYLCDILGHIAGRQELVDEVRSMRHKPTTFIFLDRFIDAMNAKGLAAPFFCLRGVRSEVVRYFVYERRGGWLSSAWHNTNKPNFPGFLILSIEHLKARSRTGRFW